MISHLGRKSKNIPLCDLSQEMVKGCRHMHLGTFTNSCVGFPSCPCLKVVFNAYISRCVLDITHVNKGVFSSHSKLTISKFEDHGVVFNHLFPRS